MLPTGAVAVILITLLHEAAHAAAVVLQGGQVTEFVWLPHGDRWGHIRFCFGHNDYSAFAIALAPYCMWLAVSLGASMLTLWRRRWPFAAASWIFVWFYAAPIGDTVYAASGWLKGSRNDFYDAFGEPGRMAAVLVAAAALTAAGLGFLVHRRLYGVSALSVGAYAVLTGAAVLAAIAI